MFASVRFVICGHLSPVPLRPLDKGSWVADGFIDYLLLRSLFSTPAEEEQEEEEEEEEEVMMMLTSFNLNQFSFFLFVRDQSRRAQHLKFPRLIDSSIPIPS